MVLRRYTAVARRRRLRLAFVLCSSPVNRRSTRDPQLPENRFYWGKRDRCGCAVSRAK